MTGQGCGGNSIRKPRSRGAGLPRLSDVAEHAGVTKMTASRVLRGVGPVSPETQARVMQAMDALGYIPNIVASNLASNRTKVIAAITPGFASPLLRDLFRGLSNTVCEHGYQILFGVTGTEMQQEEALVRAFLMRRVDGIVLTQTDHAPPVRHLLRAARIPVVEAGELARRPIDMTVGFSNEAAARAVVSHLIASGYRRIAMISEAQEERGRARERRAGHAAALRDAGIENDPAYLVEAGLGISSGAAALRTLLAGGAMPDAIFCSDDLLAMGALLECQRQGLAVPRQIAIAGFGDLEFSAGAPIPITTVRVDRTEIGCRAGALLLGALEERRLGVDSIDVGFTLVPRASTARKPSAKRSRR